MSLLIYLLLCLCVGNVFCTDIKDAFRFKAEFTDSSLSDQPTFNMMTLLTMFWKYSITHVDGHIFLGLTLVTVTIACTSILSSLMHRMRMRIKDKSEECFFNEWVLMKWHHHPFQFDEELMELFSRFPQMTGSSTLGAMMGQGAFLPSSLSGSEKNLKIDIWSKRPKGMD
ncbi:hypothetical protein LSH36_116g05030 [Paralvinella palmiformis]|uniref:Uncharacterized protein n=1 Tax=Paralvinella palmiformis TaxID=53620 RepID=A0AAD9NAI0_9ANNE|nr:hypothetical protein LSH36_116g05030 [Paralvinella palmiformis]